MELSSQDIIYNFDFEEINIIKNKYSLPEYKDEVYSKIKTALDIDNEGYNVYLIDDFSKIKLNNIKKFVNESLKYKDKPKDICYVIKDDIERPCPLFVSDGKGCFLKKTIDALENVYYKNVYNFYNTSCNEEKEKIIENIDNNRNKLVTQLIDEAYDKGFDIKSTDKGFTFMPISDGKTMTEKEYDELREEEKENILNAVSKLKIKSKDILGKLKDAELDGIEKIKKILEKFLEESLNDLKTKYKEDFSKDMEVIDFLNEMCNEIEKELVDNYSIIYDDDEDKINEIITKYDINILVDNSMNEHPQVIFEEDPNVINLMGSIEYKSENGTYLTDLSFIKNGSVLRANEGCIIIRADNLLSNPTAYYNLKRTMISGKLDLNYNKGYLEVVSLSGLNPEPVKTNFKVILIGDYETYDILYNYDNDFKKIFKIKAQYNPIVNVNNEIKNSLLNTVEEICQSNNLKSLDKGAIKQIAKFLARKTENRNKLYFDNDELNKILNLANSSVVNKKRELITGEDIENIICTEDLIERESREYYKDAKIFINVNGKKIGQINGLSILDTGYITFGKPIRITCRCYKGEGNIVDVQKQCELGGNIHNKAINILKGFVNGYLGRYNKIPVDFHLNFEQIYGKVDGDSASVAELISMISSFSNVAIKQNIAVTGSINQFGEVQPIGGVNEKIEGFFKVCKEIDSVNDKGVLIPCSNKNDLILNDEVENEIKKGNFHIYVMKDIKDAINILMGNYDDVLSNIKKEIRKYGKKNAY